MSGAKAVSARSDADPYVVNLADGRHEWLADVSQDSGGGDRAADPEAQVLGALGACTAITMRMYADRKGWKVEHIDVQLSLDLSSKTSSHIRRRIHLQGDLDESQRARLMDIANRCPVHRLLSGDIQISNESA